ncbi:transposase, partial [Shewanella sairae]
MKTPIQIASLTQTNEQLNAQVFELSEKVLTLQQQLDWFKRQLFGRKSEKLLVDNPHQDSL